MTERLLQYIWQFGHFNKSGLQTVSGEEVHIVFPGRLNPNSGPDFSEAKIRVGGTLLAGSVELHLKTSDWNRHRHSGDTNYNNVILHVVYRHDEWGAGRLPIVELSPLIPKILLQKWEGLMTQSQFIPCGSSIASVSSITWTSWKERLLAERLTRKSTAIFIYLAKNNFHWEETLWWLLARNFGIKVNSEALEELAQSIPITVLAKHKAGIHQIEALLFGQAGLLEGHFADSYPQLLQREYRFLKTKYSLQKIHAPLHFLRMRPSNFPTIRLAQLAMLVHQSQHLFSRIIELTDSGAVKALFAVTANDYWHYHYRFDEESPFRQKNLGAEMINNIMINTVVPILFSYGLYHHEEKHKLKALQWLEELPAEKNSVIDGFSQYSIANNSAYDSQAFIELRNEYCSHKRCLECSVGAAILKRD